jgi:hypothetical protein
LVDAKAAKDLQLGLDRLGDDLWQGAADLARDLDALEPFAAGLVLLPDGAALIDRLGLPAPTSAEHLMRTNGLLFPPAAALERIMAGSGWRRRLTTAWAYLFPSAAWLRHVEPESTASGWGLFRARVRRPFRILPRVLRAYCERRRFHREGRPGIGTGR